MFKIFKREKDIDRQIERFVAHKASRSIYVAERHREWLIKFSEITRIKTVFDAPPKVAEFREWVRREHSSDFYYNDAMGSVRMFLKFYRCIRWHDVI